jgi:hypothetical protein
VPRAAQRAREQEKIGVAARQDERTGRVGEQRGQHHAPGAHAIGQRSEHHAQEHGDERIRREEPADAAFPEREHERLQERAHAGHREKERERRRPDRQQVALHRRRPQPRHGQACAALGPRVGQAPGQHDAHEQKRERDRPQHAVARCGQERVAAERADRERGEARRAEQRQPVRAALGGYDVARIGEERCVDHRGADPVEHAQHVHERAEVGHGGVAGGGQAQDRAPDPHDERAAMLVEQPARERREQERGQRRERDDPADLRLARAELLEHSREVQAECAADAEDEVREGHAHERRSPQHAGRDVAACVVHR